MFFVKSTEKLRLGKEKINERAKTNFEKKEVFIHTFLFGCKVRDNQITLKQKMNINFTRKKFPTFKYIMFLTKKEEKKLCL